MTSGPQPAAAYAMAGRFAADRSMAAREQAATPAARWPACSRRAPSRRHPALHVIRTQPGQWAGNPGSSTSCGAPRPA